MGPIGLIGLKEFEKISFHNRNVASHLISNLGLFHKQAGANQCQARGMLRIAKPYAMSRLTDMLWIGLVSLVE